MTRAYFTAATCAISLFVILSVNTPSKFFPVKIVNNLFFKIVGYLGIRFISYSSINNINYLSNKRESNNLILWNNNNFSLRVQKGILTKNQRNMIEFNIIQRSILIGVILSDGWIQHRVGWNPRIGFKQSIKNFEFFWTVLLNYLIFVLVYLD